jgi:ATP-binding cassette subfamily F protein uup
MQVGAYLERFLFDRRQQRIRVSELSGGERARVCLAKLLWQRTNLLLLDEPTNDLDVATLSALESMLIDYAGSALIVSHDRWFLDRVATAILAFDGEGRVELHLGNYSDYRERVLTRKASEVAARAAEKRQAASASARNGSAKSAGKLGYSEQRELDGILERVEEAEERVSEIERNLSDPDIYQGERGALAALQSALADAQAEAERLTSRWEELDAKKSALSG